MVTILDFLALRQAMSLIRFRVCIRSSTTFRLASALAGLLIGAVWLGSWTRPARVAACGRVSWEAFTPK